jgi:HD-GYP domain-containing protein (c-di-GMP phosphodiesterase class II)
MDLKAFWSEWLSTQLDLSADTVQQLAGRFAAVNLMPDAETLEHSQQPLGLACGLAEGAGLPAGQMVAFRRGVLLHDLGKLLVPPEILGKTAPLTGEDWAVLKRHTHYGYLLLCEVAELEDSLAIPLYHHERWDGQGYPWGLAGEAIPLVARIFAVVDTWDALLSDRPFRQRFSLQKAREILIDLNGRHFDPRLVELFLQSLPAA